MRKVTIKLTDVSGTVSTKNVDKLPDATVADDKYKALGTAVANLYSSRDLSGLSVMTYTVRDVAID